MQKSTSAELDSYWTFLTLQAGPWPSSGLFITRARWAWLLNTGLIRGSSLTEQHSDCLAWAKTIDFEINEVVDWFIVLAFLKCLTVEQVAERVRHLELA